MQEEVKGSTEHAHALILIPCILCTITGRPIFLTHNHEMSRLPFLGLSGRMPVSARESQLYYFSQARPKLFFESCECVNSETKLRI